MTGLATINQRDIMSQRANSRIQWFHTVDAAFARMLQAVGSARASVRLETYIFGATAIGLRFREALIEACRRGVKVRVMVDSFGSVELPDAFWAPLRAAGADCRWFNPIGFSRFSFRDHRKVLICDDATAFLGGFNIAAEYEGDGVNRGWCDHGIELQTRMVAELAGMFDGMFARADLPQRRFIRLRRSAARLDIRCVEGDLLLCGPGRGRNPFKRALHADLRKARQIQIVMAYFLPTWTIRRLLARAARRGAQVQLILPGNSDVPIAQMAAQNLYSRLMRSGVEIYEYQPQILHAKLILVDGAVYVGSANLDMRSLHINYELMVRLTDREAVSEARQIFQADLKHALRVDPLTWRHSRSFWGKLKERWAYLLLARIDPFIAQRQMAEVD